MAVNFDAFQRSQYAVGVLVLGDNETEAAANATWEDANGPRTGPPPTIRGWAAYVEFGFAAFVCAEDASITFESPDKIYQDTTASTLDGVWFRQTTGVNATIKILVVFGGVS